MGCEWSASFGFWLSARHSLPWGEQLTILGPCETTSWLLLILWLLLRILALNSFFCFLLFLRMSRLLCIIKIGKKINTFLLFILSLFFGDLLDLRHFIISFFWLDSLLDRIWEFKEALGGILIKWDSVIVNSTGGVCLQWLLMSGLLTRKQMKAVFIGVGLSHVRCNSF